jgi:hypothetical protein
MENLMLFHTLEFTVTYPYSESVWDGLDFSVEIWSKTFDTMHELDLYLEMLEDRWDDYDSPVIGNVFIDGVLDGVEE